MNKLINWFLMLGVVTTIIGCGADSDLLRDQNIDDTPTGNAYRLLNKGIYQYKKIDGKYLGFNYYILDEECKKDSCTLLHREYTIFDGNITQQSDRKYIVLSGNGWYEKSKVNECEVRFNDSNMTLKCPDGRVETVKYKEENLEGKKIVDIVSAVINEADLKDESSKFTASAILYNTDRVNRSVRYEFIKSDDSQCYGNQHAPLTDNNIKHDKVVCSLDGQEFLLEDTNRTNGTLTIVNRMKQKFSGTWHRLQVFDNYTLIEIESQNLADNFFISYYNGLTYIGKVIKKESNGMYLNKDGFNTVYTQLSDEHTSQSLVKKDLQGGLYRLSVSVDAPIYHKISFADINHINMEYGAFFDTKPSANWILTSKGLHRESEQCESDVFFNSFRYRCDDGRDSEFARIKNTKLSEALIYSYLLEHKIDYKLDDNDTFFSIGSKEIFYRETSNADVYKFTPSSSLSVGNMPLESNASSIFGQDLFVSSFDKKHYLKIINPKIDSNGTVEVYELNSSIELNSTTENNSTFIIDNIQKIGTVQWKHENIGEKDTIIVKLGNDEKKYFKYSNHMILTIFSLSKIKIIAGTLSKEKEKPQDISYLGYNAYKDIESAIVE